MTSEWLEQLTVKSTLSTLRCYLRCPNFGPFRSTTSPFGDTRLSIVGKIGMHRMTSGWPWILTGQKYPACTEYLHASPTFWSFFLHDQPFSMYSNFIFSRLIIILNVKKKKNKKLEKKSKFETSHFANKVGRDPRSMHAFFGSVSVLYFQRRCRLNFSSHTVPC